MRILLVEDDPTTSKSIELMLTHANLNVYATDLGEEGVDLAKLYDYDLILLDLNLPDMNGHEVLRRSDPMYDLIILTNWNWPYAVKGRGSAIFIHQWRGPGRPTAGCVGLRRDHLRWIAARITHNSRLVIA